MLSKLSSGYHEIAGHYHTIGLGDFLYFRKSSEDTLTATDSSLSCDGTNLISKALSLFRDQTGILDPIEIHVDKRIPMKAGLGGGSSNAATTLYALTKLFEVSVSDEDLMKWGSMLGSDPGFFFSSGSAFVSGWGENIQSMSWSLSQNIWIAKPDIGMSTQEVFAHAKITNKTDPQEILKTLREGDFSHCANDLEPAVFKLSPKLKAYKESLLESGFTSAIMTGSGSAFFCLGTPIFQRSDACKYSFITREKNQWYLSPKAGKLDA